MNHFYLFLAVDLVPVHRQPVVLLLDLHRRLVFFRVITQGLRLFSLRAFLSVCLGCSPGFGLFHRLHMSVQNGRKFILLQQFRFIFGFFVFIFHDFFDGFFINLFFRCRFIRNELFFLCLGVVHHRPQKIIVQLVKPLTMQRIEDLALLHVARLRQVINIFL